MTQAYGARPEYYARYGFPGGHEGLDYAAPEGTDVYAAAAGTVTTVYRDDGRHPYGNHVRIQHGRYETIYGHLSGFERELTPGASVQAGQRIGRMGSTGNSTGVHLHFTLKRDGAVIDPSPFLK